jgi:hypothetical protein
MVASDLNENQMKTLVALVCLSMPLAGCVTAEQQTAINASVDANDCHSYGAAEGTPEYFQCRMTKDQTRVLVTQIQQQRAQEQFNQGLATMAAGLHGY